MRLLQLHCDFIEYEPVKKEIDLAEEAEARKTRLKDLVVLFVSVEEGDDEATVSKAVEEVKESLRALKANRMLLYPYSHLSSSLAEPSEALRLVREMYRVAIEAGLEAYRAPFGWTKAFSVKVKGHPLAEQSRSISRPAAEGREVVSQALRAEERLESTFHIMTPDGEMTPVADFDLAGYENLEKLAKHEMEKVRAAPGQPPHIDLMKRLGLVDYEAGSDLGNLRFYPKGRLVKALLERLISQRVREYGGLEVETPVMYDFRHPSLADYLHRFPARQYVVRSEEKELFLRFSACFGQFLMAKDAQMSYRQLPIRLYELTRYSFRREQSGELVGLKRLRAFTMPDCHALCADIEQAKEELIVRFNLSKGLLKEIGLDEGDYELAVRFTDDFYKEHSDFIKLLVKTHGRPAFVEMWRGRFFYFVMKWEFNFIDNQEKASALSTDQIDVENARRYGITYVTPDGSTAYPVILHNSPSGAVERCIFALLEKAYRMMLDGRAPVLPLWLSPTQVRLIPVSGQYTGRAEALAQELESHQIRVDVDDREESVAKRIRDAEREWVPYIIVLGEKEASSPTLQARDREGGEIRLMTAGELEEEIRSRTEGRPFLPLPPPRLLSKKLQFS